MAVDDMHPGVTSGETPSGSAFHLDAAHVLAATRSSSNESSLLAAHRGAEHARDLVGRQHGDADRSEFVAAAVIQSRDRVRGRHDPEVALTGLIDRSAR